MLQCNAVSNAHRSQIPTRMPSEQKVLGGGGKSSFVDLHTAMHGPAFAPGANDPPGKVGPVGPLTRTEAHCGQHRLEDMVKCLREGEGGYFLRINER